MNRMKNFLYTYKYEVLLFALMQHLFSGIFVPDLSNYHKAIWLINIVFLGVASIGVFIQKEKRKKIIQNILLLLVALFTIALPFYNTILNFKVAVNVVYIVFFSFIFWELLKFLIRPSHIDFNVISAAACGYFLLIEISVFIMQNHFYLNPNSFKGIDTTSPFASFIDLVYFSSITFTSIGFGDIIPNSHQTKLFTAFIGIVGQFYTVVLVGILISKFSSKEKE
ncbi:Ion transport 2 domain protein [Flavobacterium laiguense]|uniref:Ion transport 2 domain protein n=2 Tax=Flavobacterium laiguense TaxID=2169409 RepID=A0A2U1K1S4_9FLAO|nr:Ion transport 2 domain protein [Flavobacterium laiguense]